jgi:murein DD-endopeptidase MepM/ murein hydrolase activator NlpD
MGNERLGRFARFSLAISLWAVGAVHAQSWTAVPLGNQGGSLAITGPFDGPNPVNPNSPNKFHTGVDIVSSDRTVKAVADGVVSKVQGNDGCQCGAPKSECEDRGFGNSIIIEHDAPRGGKIYSLYAHLHDKPTLKEGVDKVTLGEQIGVMGQTAFGCPTGVDLHLHWETKTAPVLENPTGTPTTFGYGPVPSEQPSVPISVGHFASLQLE